jgi:hypothetical protein
MHGDGPGDKLLASELQEIIKELTDLRNQSRISRWDLGMWVLS